MATKEELSAEAVHAKVSWCQEIITDGQTYKHQLSLAMLNNTRQPRSICGDQ